MKPYIFILSIFTSSLLFSQSYVITKFGAKPGDKIDNTKAIQKAIDEASKKGGEIIFPAGTFYTGSIVLRSNITITLQKNAVWKAIPDTSLFPYYSRSLVSRYDYKRPWRAFLFADGIENISLRGEGCIDGNGSHPVFQNHKDDNPERPYGILFVACKNILVEGLFLTNSAHWLQRYLECDHVSIQNISVFNHANLNNDGIDIDGCHNVRISNSIFDASDDAICLKSEGIRDCRDVVITNCIASSHASGIKLGTGSAGGFKRITISNCIVRPSKATVMHHPFKWWEGIAGIDLGSVDGGILEDITISNIVIDSVKTPIFMKLGDRLGRPWEKDPRAHPGSFRNISINNVIIRNAGTIASSITGYPGNYIENVSLSNIQIEMLYPGYTPNNSIYVPEIMRGYPVTSMFGLDLPAFGFYIRHAKNVTFSNISIKQANGDARPGLVLEDVMNSKFDNLSFLNVTENKNLIRIAKSENISFNDMPQLKNGNKYLIGIEDSDCKNITLPELHPLDIIREVTNISAKGMVDKVSKICLTWEHPYQENHQLYAFQIFREEQLIAVTQSQSFIDSNIDGNKKYKYQIQTIRIDNKLSAKSAISFTSIPDNVKPELLKLSIEDRETIILEFTEALHQNSNDITKFTISPTLSIISAKLIDEGKTIKLQVSPLQEKINYSLSIQSITDKAGNTTNISSSFIDNPLMAWFRFENDTRDQVNPTEILNQKNTLYTKGINGKALLLNGKSSVLSTNTKLYDHQSNMSISVWYKLTHSELYAFTRILSKKAKWNAHEGYELEITPYINKFNVTGANTDAEYQGNMIFPCDTLWHHLIAVIKNGKAYFYIDGNHVGMDETVAMPAYSSIPLCIGNTLDGNNGFKGLLDELRIFNRSLSDNEIKELWNKR